MHILYFRINIYRKLHFFGNDYIHYAQNRFSGRSDSALLFNLTNTPQYPVKQTKYSQLILIEQLF